MPRFPPLETFGTRICVCGPSSVGKSTLTEAIADRIGVPAVHVDRLRHLPHTRWEPRPDSEFERLHDEAIAREAWIMDGNYSHLLPRRLERATGIILLGGNRWARLARYFNRTVFQRRRPGALAGNKDRITWTMIHWILGPSPRALEHYRNELPNAGLPYLYVGSMRELNSLYRAWALRPPR